MTTAPKTVLITGCSSGFGLETARLFLDRGWRVIATMRTPRTDLLPASAHLRVLPLDVADSASIARLAAEAGPVDVLVNNAGIGWLGPVEGTPMEAVRQVFETNTFGTMALTQALLPQFRERGSGVIVNVTSTVTLIPLPLLPVYTASKAAVNAFTECLALELAPLGITARLVLPGLSLATRFGENARTNMADRGSCPEAYAGLMQSVLDGFATAHEQPHTRPEDVAEAVWRAATDPAAPMRQPAGADAVAVAETVRR